jgi:hypothetical protein
MNNHYWPGELITTLPFEVAWDTFDWDLPYSTTGPNAYQPGYDNNFPLQTVGPNPTNQIDHEGGNGVIYQIVGEGREVTFRAENPDPRGLIMTLIKPGFLGAPRFRAGWVDYSSSGRGSYPQSVVITAMLNEGETYHIWVASMSYIDVGHRSDGSTYLHYGDSFTLSVDYTDRPTNNQRMSAADVIIGADGGTYNSKPTLNHEFDASSSSGLDDPSGQGLILTGWWKYEPEHATDFTIAATVDPEGWPLYDVRWYRGEAGSNTMPNNAVGGSSGPAAAPLNGHLNAGDVAWIVIGSRGDQYDNPSQIYRLTVTGARSVVQLPVPPPANDKRVNATTVAIATEGDTFTSAWVDNTFATVEDVLGTDDPQGQDLFHTVWWKYTPVADGPINATILSDPADALNVVLREYRTDADGLYVFGEVDSTNDNPFLLDDAHHATEVNSTRLYMVGVRQEGTLNVLYQLKVTGPVSVVPAPEDDPNADIPDFDPGADQFDPFVPQIPTEDPTKETRPLLDLIREFSSKIKRAVRITAVDTVPDPSQPLVRPYATVTLVDPHAKNRMQIANPAAIYSGAVDESRAGETKVALIGANNVKAASATLVNDDATILLSGWRIPDYLPIATVNGQTPALKPVKSVRLSFTRDKFSGDIEFHSR